MGDRTCMLLMATAMAMGAIPAAAVDGFSATNSRRLEALMASGPGLAVFDADGTLWSDDAGEGFYGWLVEQRRLKGVDYSHDPVAEYFAVEAKDQPLAYGMAVTQMAGLSEDAVKRWAASYFRVAFAKRVHQPQKNLIAALRAHGWDVWIVSASNRWIIQAGAPYVGVDPSHVVGIDLVVRDGVLTDRLAYPVTWGPGKAEAIARLIARRPDLATGDSRGDLEMLMSARGLALLVAHPEKASQKQMRTLARRRGWLVQQMP
ncbi:MAG: HAD-IB family phosphatase [Candidatus Wallbacteria bacterium]|nr:HAD-IB family phosphatase [Candidatus Wallbacteria bacterium]